jgi:hypothetical protein
VVLRVSKNPLISESEEFQLLVDELEQVSEKINQRAEAIKIMRRFVGNGQGLKKLSEHFSRKNDAQKVESQSSNVICFPGRHSGKSTFSQRFTP